MTRRWFAALLLCGSSIAHADGGWSALWHTPDQRGEAALHAGDAAAAAAAYSDLRRKAYAQLKAGDYRGAAQSYAGFDDAEAHYNRGNALARAGDLQQALRAYDAALAKNPGDADAQRNRDLVARALQPPPPGSAPGRQPSAQAGGQAPPPPGPVASGRPGGDPAPGRGTAASPGPAPSPAGANSAGASGDPAAPASSRTAATGSAGARDAAGAAAPDPANTDDAAQAQRDVIGGAPRAAGRRDPQDAKREPPTEQQLSEEQWLRRLPDDPGGLLRRKFLIQQLIRQGTPP